jgi:hypothetical protein
VVLKTETLLRIVLIGVIAFFALGIVYGLVRLIFT